MASAYHAAAAHALPSWAEGAALANLEAAAAGCPIVVSDRSSEFEYFGDLATYCDPADPALDPRRESSPRSTAARASPSALRELGGADGRAALGERPPARPCAPTRRRCKDFARRAGGAGRRRRGRGRKPSSARACASSPTACPGPGSRSSTSCASVAEAIPDGARVLDVGAGEAPYRELFEHTEYVTTDWANSVHPGARAVDIVGPADDLPVDDESFDFVLLTEVLEHTPDPTAVVRELHRILRPGGQLHMTTPFVWELHELPFDFFRYTPWGLDRVLRDAGFAGVDIAPRNDSLRPRSRRC